MAANPSSPKDVFYVIPHTHWEGAVFKTRDAYLDVGLPHILRAMQLLEAYPDYRFTLDQACYVEPFLERYPEHADAFRRYVDEGRLAIVGGTDSMLDVNMPSGESFVRQVLYGKGYFRRELGVDVTIGWLLDTFGHHAQMPQLLRQAGFDSLWFFRGVPSWDVPSEFFWEGLDGTQVAAYWLPHGYGIAYHSPHDADAFAEFFKERFDSLEPFARGAVRVAASGADVSQPEEHVPRLIGQLAADSDLPFEMRIATPADYEAAIDSSGSERPVVTGEFNPIFQGIYSSRIELKQITRELERGLTNAEKLGVTLRALGEPADDDRLWDAWEPMLFNQAHDLMSGVMTDRVYEDTVRGYDFSHAIAKDEEDSRLRRIASRVDTRGGGIPLVVHNTLSWERTDIAIATVGFAGGAVSDVKSVDSDGREVPVQLLRTERNEDGSLIEAEVALVARDVPALGHAVYHLVPAASESSGASATVSEHHPHVDTDLYHVEFDPAGGAITKLVAKAQDWSVLGGPANVVARETDEGDLWEPYRSLDAGSRIAMKERHPVASDAVFSDGESGEPGAVTSGRVVSEFAVRHAFAGGEFGTRVRVYNGLPRLDIQTSILNNESFVRYRAMFPTSIGGGTSVHEIPFGAIERPDGIEFPAQNWVDHSDGARGVVLLNRGLPGNNTDDGTILLSLMRSTRIVAYGFGGGYEPGMSSDTGLELGKEFCFDYALLPHAGDWRGAKAYRDGMEFNNPLMVRTAAPHTGSLPSRWGVLSVSHPNVVASTLKRGDGDSAVLRVYEAAGEPVEGATVEFAAGVESAEEVNLMEDAVQDIPATGDTVRFGMRPFEIKTIRVRLRSPIGR